MMRKARLNIQNGCYHIYNQGVNKINIFRDKQDNLTWLSLLKEAQEKYHVNVFCFVTMVNHFHVLIETEKANLSKVLWHMGYYFARYMNSKYGRVGPLCRNRCQSQMVLQDSYFKNVVRYIHYNPIAAGYIKEVEETNPQIYSSFSDLAGLTKNYPWLSKKKLFERFGFNEDYANSRKLVENVSKRQFYEETRIEKIFVELH